VWDSLKPSRAAGCAKVFKEKASGARSDRPELVKVIRRLESGDVLVVTRLDRLARSTRDLLNVLDELAKRGTGFRSLKDAWADTTTPHGKLMLTVLGGLAEFERELIRARTGEGRKRAQERGVRFGRPRKLTAHQRDEALQRLRHSETQAGIARTYNVDPANGWAPSASCPGELNAVKWLAGAISFSMLGATSPSAEERRGAAGDADDGLRPVPLQLGQT
jgi:DNA invertase Pin-like site-specific DNA recombinase